MITLGDVIDMAEANAVSAYEQRHVLGHVETYETIVRKTARAWGDGVVTVEAYALETFRRHYARQSFQR